MWTKEEKKLVQEAIHEAEAHTTGQIVPVVVEHSGNYSWVTYVSSLVGLVSGTLVGLVNWMLLPWMTDVPVLLVLQFTGALWGWTLGKFPFWIRWMVGGMRLQREVHDHAMASFVRNGVHETHHRVGVLIFISLLEKRVQIIADKGIHDKVGNDFWHGEALKLAKGIRENDSVAAMISVVKEIGARLEKDFPAAVHENELSDEVRER